MTTVSVVHLTFQTTAEDARRLNDLAERSDRTRSAELRRAVRQYLERETKEAA